MTEEKTLHERFYELEMLLGKLNQQRELCITELNKIIKQIEDSKIDTNPDHNPKVTEEIKSDGVKT